MWAQMNEDVQLLNGEVWQSPMGVKGLAQWLDEDFWVLLREPKDTGDGGTRMEALQHSAGVCYFSHAELYQWLQRNGWQKINSRITLQE